MPAKDYTRWTQNENGTWRLKTLEEKFADASEDKVEETESYSDWTVAELDEKFGDADGYPSYENKAAKVAFAEAQ